MGKLCLECNKMNNDTDKYCLECGKELTINKCLRCGSEMIPDLEIEGDHPFEVGVGSNSNIIVFMPPKSNSGLPLMQRGYVRAKVCKKCGYLETYVSNIDKYE